MQCFLDGTYYQKHPMNLSRVCKIFRVSRNGYYAWLERQKDTEKRRAKQEERDRLKERMREIIQKLGYVPGARAFREEFYRCYQISVSRVECRELMEEMNLVANKPKKDAYIAYIRHHIFQCKLSGSASPLHFDQSVPTIFQLEHPDPQ